MRQRVTFLQRPEDSVDPKLLKVGSNSISTKQLNAALEHRTTFSFEELPQELYRVLKASHELHIRWVSPLNYMSIAPVVSRLSPGLHVYYTPQRNSNSSYVFPQDFLKYSALTAPRNLLCPLLNKVFGELDCLSPEVSLIFPLSLHN